MSFWKSYVSRRYNTKYYRRAINGSYPGQETDKATIDVEAQDDGILGKIIVRFNDSRPHHRIQYLCI